MASIQGASTAAEHVDLEKQQANTDRLIMTSSYLEVSSTSSPVKTSIQSQRRRARSDIISRQGHQIHPDEQEIIKATSHHEIFTFNGTTLKGLGKFDDSRSYGISAEEEKKLHKIEVRRLIQSVSGDGAFLFNSQAMLLNTTKESFQDVSSVIDQILCNFEIIKHDNARLLLEHCPSEMDRGTKDFTRSRSRLYARYMQDQDRVEGYQPKCLKPPERNEALYFALVDYLLGSLGRLLLRSGKSKFWELNIMSTLAMWATKLKNLSNDPARYAAQSVSDGEDIMNQTIASVALKQAFVLKFKTGADRSEQKEVDAFDSEFDIKAQYYFQKISFRYLLEALLRATAGSLLKTENTSLNASCFEACSLVYRAGLEGQPTLLSNDRDGDVYASSDPTTINCAYTAMGLLLKNVEALSPTQDQEPRTRQGIQQDTDSARPTEVNAWASIQWEWSGGEPNGAINNTTWRVTKMDHLISVAIGLGLATAYVASSIDRLIHIASNATKEEDPVIQFEAPPKDFQALFKITTSEYTRMSSLPDAPYSDLEVKPVADIPMRRRIRAGTKISEQSQLLETTDASAEASSQKLLARDRLTMEKMDAWVITEDSIIIKCRRYVLSIVLIAMIIVLGGMSVPFAVKERITGVDPFQITTFSWLIAAFVTVLAKSRYVSQWPWHDFLRGQVICNSVADVHDVTGVNSQMIIWYVLHAEHENILRTKGPYNGMFGQLNSTEGNSMEEVDAIKAMYNAIFGRKGQQTGGFAIDVPVDHSTMLASGFILLKVLNDKGEHLICVDVRKGTESAGYAKRDKDMFLSCMNVEKDITELTSMNKSQESASNQMEKERSKVLKLTTNEFRWTKMLGIYVRDCTFG